MRGGLITVSMGLLHKGDDDNAVIMYEMPHRKKVKCGELCGPTRSTSSRLNFTEIDSAGN